MNRVSEAESILKETAQSHPDDPSYQIVWGRALLASGNVQQASEVFKSAQILAPADPEPIAEQGLALLALEQTAQATPLLKDSAKKVDPPLAITLSGLGLVYEQKGLRDISKDFFRQALIRDGSNTVCLLYTSPSPRDRQKSRMPSSA